MVLSILPADLLHVLCFRFLNPREVARLRLVSNVFKVALSVDTIWLPRLPRVVNVQPGQAMLKYSDLRSEGILSRYGPDKELGAGAFGTVFGGVDLETGEAVAMKFIQNVRLQAAKEADLHARALPHPHIVRLLDSGPSRDEFVLVMEKCDGELFNLLMERNSGLPDVADPSNPLSLRSISRSLIKAVEHLHSLGIVHCDLKLENVMIKDGSVVIIDFGMAFSVLDKLPTKARGTPAYTAPEVWTPGMSFASPADIWSLGVILFALVHGSFFVEKARPTDPFYRYLKEQMNLFAFRGAVAAFRRYYPNLDFPPLSPEMTELIDGMLQPCPDRRVTAAQALQSPLFDDDMLPYAGLPEPDSSSDDELYRSLGGGLQKSGSPQGVQYRSLSGSPAHEIHSHRPPQLQRAFGFEHDVEDYGTSHRGITP